jgi:hypothetical protein
VTDALEQVRGAHTISLAFDSRGGATSRTGTEAALAPAGSGRPHSMAGQPAACRQPLTVQTGIVQSPTASGRSWPGSSCSVAGAGNDPDAKERSLERLDQRGRRVTGHGDIEGVDASNDHGRDGDRSPQALARRGTVVENTSKHQLLGHADQDSEGNWPGISLCLHNPSFRNTWSRSGRPDPQEADTS